MQESPLPRTEAPPWWGAPPAGTPLSRQPAAAGPVVSACAPPAAGQHKAAIAQHWSSIGIASEQRQGADAVPPLLQCFSNAAPTQLHRCLNAAPKKNGKPKMGGGERPAPGREKRKKGRCMGKTPSWRGLPRTRRMSARVPQGISPDRG